MTPSPHFRERSCQEHNNRLGIEGMIVSDKKRFVFISNPKTGTHSMFDVLENNPEFAAKREGKQFHEWKVPQRAKNYIKFSTVRNPYSRIVALWNSLLMAGAREGGEIPKKYRQTYMHVIGSDSFEDYCKFCAENRDTIEHTKIIRYPLLSIPQWRWYQEYLPPDTKPLKIENIQEEFNALPFVEKEIMIPTKLKRKHETWDELKNNNIIEYVNHWAEKDFELFGYEKEVLT